MVTLMDYVESRLNADGMAEGQPDDWIFVDWVDFPMHKRGTLCFEQILLCKALETMALCAKLLGINKSDYRVKAEQLRNKVRQTFWSYEQKAYYHAIEDGQMNRQITKFPNMFAILYGYAYEEQRREIMQSVMLNPDIPAITTPYMRFYELETLCMDGRRCATIGAACCAKGRPRSGRSTCRRNQARNIWLCTAAPTASRSVMLGVLRPSIC